MKIACVSGSPSRQLNSSTCGPLAVSKDGGRVLFNGRDNVLRLWASDTFKKVAETSANNGPLAVFPKENIVAFGQGQTVHLRDMKGNNTFAQHWQFQDAGGGYRRVNNRNAVPQVWDVSGVSTAEGAKVHLWSYGNAANQQWLPESLGGGYWRFRARHSGRCLDVSGASTADSGRPIRACGRPP